MDFSVTENLLPYSQKLEYRPLQSIHMIVIHCTELPTLDMAREYGEKVLYEDGTGNSGHYYVDRNGAIIRYVPEDRVARHVVGHNRNSIGIEIVNEGRYPQWYCVSHQQPKEPYTAEQIVAVKNLLKDLKQRFPWLQQIARHSDLDTQTLAAEDDPKVEIRRKIDPGPLFPWEEILKFWEEIQGTKSVP